MLQSTEEKIKNYKKEAFYERTEETVLKLLLADDHGLFREGFAMIINSAFPNSEVCQVKDWTQAHEHSKKTKFDLALLDLFMPGKKMWKEELSLFLHSAPKLDVCVVSSSTRKVDMQTARTLGAKGYLSKIAEIDEMKRALEQLRNGDMYFPPLEQEMHWFKTKNTAQMTARQREVLNLIAEGNSNKSIANQLFLTEGTVKRHVYNIFKLLNAKNRTEAVLLAYQQDILRAC